MIIHILSMMFKEFRRGRSAMDYLCRGFVSWYCSRNGFRIIWKKSSTDNFYRMTGKYAWHWFTWPVIEEADEEFVSYFCNQNTLFIDGGAFVGDYTITAIEKGSHVICAEPDAEKIKELNDLIYINSVQDRVIIVPKALGSKECLIKFSPGNLLCAIGHISDSNDSNFVNVPMTTLDKILEDYKFNDKINKIFLKLDLEGAEDLALEGATMLLKDKRLKAILVEKNLSSWNNVDRILNLHGFEEVTFNPRNKMFVLGRKESWKYKYNAQNNAVFVRDMDIIDFH